MVILSFFLKYLYLSLELLLYVVTALLYVPVFSKYRYHPRLENRIEQRLKTPLWKDILFLGFFAIVVCIIFLIWHKLAPSRPHQIGYFLAFFSGTMLALAFFKAWIRHVDLKLCFPSIFFVWILLLVLETLLIWTKSGWIYTNSTVFAIHIGNDVTFILENIIFFYAFSPFMSILIFTGLAHKRSDISAFFLTLSIIWATGVVWEYICIGIFNLWYMVEERSIMPFNLLTARTTIEEMLYYVPFAAISILLYLLFYYKKYRYKFNAGASIARSNGSH